MSSRMIARILVTALVTGSSLCCTASTFEDPASSEVVSEAVPATWTGTSDDTTFPRTASYYLDQDRLPPVEELGRYDLVVIDHEWAHRAPRSYFDELRTFNPRIKLLAYVNLVDYPESLGSRGYWAGRYDLWQYHTPSVSTFPPEWLATTESGETVSEWPRTTMTNLTDVAPQVDGMTFAEYAAHWVVDRVWSAGVWDGVLLDVWGDRIYTADQDRWDIDGDGDDESDSRIYGPDGPWARGISLAERIMRERMPDAILIANGDRTLDGGALDGRAWESFADPLADRDPRTDVGSYLSESSNSEHRPPGVWMTIDRLGFGASESESYRRARFFLTSTLLQDGYWAPMGHHYGGTSYYDEIDGAGLGPGYLGLPLSAGPDDVDNGQGVYRRDFENGIVVVNVGDDTEHVRLEQPYRHLQGTQDPYVNNGWLTEEITLEPQDGIILLRVP